MAEEEARKKISAIVRLNSLQQLLTGQVTFFVCLFSFLSGPWTVLGCPLLWSQAAKSYWETKVK